jgi:hypothetical protein
MAILAGIRGLVQTIVPRMFQMCKTREHTACAVRGEGGFRVTTEQAKLEQQAGQARDILVDLFKHLPDSQVGPVAVA